MASSSSSSRQMKHQVFLSFRGEDTRLNFTVHLLQALKDKGLNVFFDEEKLEKGEELSHALSQAIAASDLSILVLSKDYASSQSCLAELSDIMDRKRMPTDKHIVLPIFYHVDPSDVRNIGGTFKTSFEEHESKRPIEDMKRWKVAFAEIGASKGWHIEGGKSDRFETEYIKDVVEYVLKKLNSNCRSVSEELVGIDDQKKKLLVLIEQAGIHVIGLWGIKLDMFQMDELQLCPSVFQNMLNLKYICFYDSKIEKGYRNPKFLIEQVDSISLPNKLRYLCWDYFPLKTLSSFNPKNLVMLILRSGNMEQLWNENDHMNLVNLREIDVSNCKKLRKIPNLSRALNLELLDCSYCESLFELPCLNHLASRDEDKLRLEGCYSLKKFPQVPSHFCYLDLRETEIQEVPDAIKYLHKLERLLLSKSKVEKVSINISKLELLSELNLSECPMVEFPKIPRSLTWLDLSGTGIEEAALSLDSLSNLQYLNMSGSSIQKLMCNITLFGSREFPTVDLPTPSLRSKILNHMRMDRCESLKLLSELPPYMQNLNVQCCTSLEKVSFADQDLYQFDSLGDDLFGMLFCNCINLNQESIDNIEENAMLKIGSLAKKWAARYDWKYQREDFPRLICCFPGNKISADKFKCQRMNSSLSLKIAPNRGSGSRFLVFAICLVADLTHCHRFKYLNCICEYHLTAAGGGDSKSYISKISFFDCSEPNKYKGDHVFILSSNDMVEEDKNYEEASFKFYIIDNDDEVNEEEDYNKVERCGVHVFYVDATEKRVAGNKRSFSHDGEEGDGGLKRLK
ncbi:hypothetical protein GOBAR_DD28799 [Gossypium barbadense]|nr:hypothetical protein GOBAR_DD28799 [Gossypium barbadense]